MATTNTSVTTTWTKVADDSDDPVTVTWRNGAYLEVAMTAADSAPTVDRGHLLKSGDVVTRNAVGDGYMWLRCDPAGSFSSALIEVTK